MRGCQSNGVLARQTDMSAQIQVARSDTFQVSHLLGVSVQHSICLVTICSTMPLSTSAYHLLQNSTNRPSRKPSEPLCSEAISRR